MLAEEMQREFSRQRDHLERTLAGVRKKLAKDTALHKSEFIRVMHVSYNFVILKIKLYPGDDLERDYLALNVALLIGK